MNAAVAKGQVGIIGLGIMGGAIAKNLSAAGWQVIGRRSRSTRTCTTCPRTSSPT